MTTTPQLDRATPSRRRSTYREQTYEVRLAGDDPTALVRVLTTLRRRRCVVLRVDYRAADAHGPGWLTIGFEPARDHAHAVPAWLMNLVDVADVRPLA